MNHLFQKCSRNLKNEMPFNKSSKTVIENSFSMSLTASFYQNLQDRHFQSILAREKDATGAYSINRGL